MIGLFSLQHTKMCDLGDCLAARSYIALALQAYRTLPQFPMIGLFSLQHPKMCDLGDCLAARSSIALALQAYRTLPKFPAGLVSHGEGKLRTCLNALRR